MNPIMMRMGRFQVVGYAILIHDRDKDEKTVIYSDSVYQAEFSIEQETYDIQSADNIVADVQTVVRRCIAKLESKNFKMQKEYRTMKDVFELEDKSAASGGTGKQLPGN